MESLQKSLPLFCACSPSNLICFRSVRCWRTMIPGKAFTRFAKFKGIVSVNDFRFLAGSNKCCKLLCGSREVLFYMGMIVSTVLPSLVPPQRIDDCVEIHILHLELLWSTVVNSPIFRSWHDCTSASSARRPCTSGSQADIAISVLREESKKMLCLTRYHFCSRLWRMNWKRLGVLEHFHLPDCPWNLLAISGRSLLFGFAVSADPRDEFPRTPSHTHTLTPCWCGMLCRGYGILRWRCRRCGRRWTWRACR